MPLLIVQDLFAVAGQSALATYVLPARRFAEKDGTFVNHAGPGPGDPLGVRPRRRGETPDRWARSSLDLLRTRRGLCCTPADAAQGTGRGAMPSLRRRLAERGRWRTERRFELGSEPRLGQSRHGQASSRPAAHASPAERALASTLA